MFINNQMKNSTQTKYSSKYYRRVSVLVFNSLYLFSKRHCLFLLKGQRSATLLEALH
jgi:hypothetical protein